MYRFFPAYLTYEVAPRSDDCQCGLQAVTLHMRIAKKEKSLELKLSPDILRGHCINPHRVTVK